MFSRLGSLLVREGLLTPGQKLLATETAEDNDIPFIEAIASMELVSEDRLVDVMRKQLIVPVATPDMVMHVAPDTISLVPASMARKFLICPVDQETGGILKLVMADASDGHVLDEVGYHTQRKIVRLLAPLSMVHWAIQKYYQIDMGHPLPPWERQATEEIILLTKVKAPVPGVPDPLESADDTEAILLTPAMRRDLSPHAPEHDGFPPPPSLAPPPSAPPPSAPPPSAPSRASTPTVTVDQAAQPRDDVASADTLPPIATTLQPSPHETPPPVTSGNLSPSPAKGGASRDPVEVPPLPAVPASSRTPTQSHGSVAKSGAETGRRKSRETLLGVPRYDVRKPVDPTAYKAVSGSLKAPSVATKLSSPRGIQPAAGRSDAGLWSSSQPGAAADQNLRSDIFVEVSFALKRARDRDEVGRQVCRYFQEHFFNVAYLVLKKGLLVGWDGGGTRLTLESIRNISIPTDQASSFRDVISSRLPRRGRLDTHPADRHFEATIGYQPDSVSFIPIMIRDKVVGLVYADGPHAPLNEAEIRDLLTETESSYERVIRQGRGS